MLLQLDTEYEDLSDLAKKLSEVVLPLTLSKEPYCIGESEIQE